jgi:hypothetical protein
VASTQQSRRQPPLLRALLLLPLTLAMMQCATLSAPLTDQLLQWLQSSQQQQLTAL